MPEPKAAPKVKNVATAPMVYFDQVPTLGLMSGIVELDLAARVLVPYGDNRVGAEVTCVAHLRCSVAAAMNLRQAIDRALEMATANNGGVDPTEYERAASRH